MKCGVFSCKIGKLLKGVHDDVAVTLIVAVDLLQVKYSSLVLQEKYKYRKKIKG